jgi:hypothetical protein
MKPARLLALVAAAASALNASALAVPPAPVAGIEAAPEGAEATVAERHPTDEAVRRGMDEIRAAIGTRRAASLDAAAYAELAILIEAQANAILQQTRLAPRARKPLQVLLGDMLEGTALMKSAANAEARRLGLVKVVQDLNRYGHQFDHPGWQPLDE